MKPPFALTDVACPHAWNESVLVVPHHQSALHKEECAYCCRTCRQEGGTLVCMCCHTGVCLEHVAKHVSLYPTHVMYVWIKELPPKPEDSETSKDVNKLGVVKPKMYESVVCCSACAVSFVIPPELSLNCYERIVHAMSTGAKDAVDADGAEYTRPQCPHLICLEQLPSPFQTAPTSSDKCDFNGCECRLNNWMCMTCGAIGCPRELAGGSGHALQHHMSTTHPAVVKLGTVTPSGADFYCYVCEDEVSDAYFSEHMKHFGIDVKTAKKTAKTLGEMEYDYSSQFDFKCITESGESLVPAFGPGRTGIHNLGNSCYIASVLQCLFSLGSFRNFFYFNGETRHQNVCAANPYNCHTCQTERVASGLLSGEFSVDGNEQTNGIAVREFKRVFAQTHPSFSTAEQQDAQEYFLYLIEQMRRHVKVPTGVDVGVFHPVDVFQMTVEHRGQCGSCRRVRYTREIDCCLSLPIPMDKIAMKRSEKPANVENNPDRPRLSLETCIASIVQPVDVDYFCGACGVGVKLSKTTRLATFPDVLSIALRRAQFDGETMTVKKLDVFVDAPEELDLSALRGGGLQAGEVEMPDTEDDPPHKPVVAATRQVDETALATLLSMGIEEAVARYALSQTDMNVERAVEYVFSHENIEQEAGLAAGSAHAKDSKESGATRVRDGPAKYRLHAMISHMGANAKTGHYVCHIRDAETGKWLLFNDEKVAESRNPPFSMAFFYFYKRETN